MTIEELQTRTEDALSKGATDVYVDLDSNIIFVSVVNGKSTTHETIDESELQDPNE